MIRARQSIGGFGMIEVLVALVILLVSGLGLAGLAVRTTQQETESYQRIQALLLLQDMVDRMNANRKVINCYSNDANGVTLGTGFSGTIPSCTSGSTAQNRQASIDLTDWNDLLLGTSQKITSSTNPNATINAGAVINARGCIVQVDATQKIYRVTVAWQGIGKTVAPNSTCGQNNYGDEALRRTVNAIVQIGSLSS